MTRLKNWMFIDEEITSNLSYPISSLISIVTTLKCFLAEDGAKNELEYFLFPHTVFFTSSHRI